MAGMSASTHLAALLCVAMISAGQVLFKSAAGSLRMAGTLFDVGTLVTIVLALAIYGAATLLWVYLLQNAPLSRLYPYMALSFVLVAIASATIFGEPIVLAQIAGLTLIVAGIVVIALA